MTRKSDENWTEWLSAEAAGDEDRADAALGRAMRGVLRHAPPPALSVRLLQSAAAPRALLEARSERFDRRRLGGPGARHDHSARRRRRWPADDRCRTRRDLDCTRLRLVDRLVECGCFDLERAVGDGRGPGARRLEPDGECGPDDRPHVGIECVAGVEPVSPGREELRPCVPLHVGVCACSCMRPSLSHSGQASERRNRRSSAPI